MVFLRIAGAVVVGYIAFAAASMMLVGPAITKTGWLMMAGALLGLVIIGLISGLIASTIAGEKARLSAMILAGLVAAATFANLAMGLGAEPNWYKIGTLVLTVPIIIVVGIRRSAAAST